MELFISMFRYAHIASGFIAFFVAPVALLSAKGGNTHRKWGLIYFWAMTSATLTSLPVALYRPNLFLFLVGIFSFHLAFSGYRSLKFKQENFKAAWLDWSVSIMTGITGLTLITLGLINPGGSFFLMYIIFGIIGTFVAVIDIIKFKRAVQPKMDWYFNHMAGMTGSYIAAVSAFSAVNFSFLPNGVRWLWPTLIGIPLTSYWIRSRKKKLTTVS